MDDPFNPANLASSLLVKIGQGTADADFARAISAASSAAQTTHKRAKVTLVVTVEPNEDAGALVLRANVEVKLPKLSNPATLMHVGARGELMTQQDFLLGGGPDEPAPAEPELHMTRKSGRMQVQAITQPPAAAPLAPAPKPAPLREKE